MDTVVAALSPHPATPAPAVRSLAVRVARADDVSLSFRLVGALEALRIPERIAMAGRADGLWRHTCFEVFVGGAGAAAYRELNFSPSGEWAAYAFSAYRRRAGAACVAGVRRPIARWWRGPDRLALDVVLPREEAEPLGGEPLHVGVTAVVESCDGRLSYWALRHPPGPPDFHHALTRALVLPPPHP